jgi:F-type H+-transporting ATPase subunit c
MWVFPWLTRTTITESINLHRRLTRLWENPMNSKLYALVPAVVALLMISAPAHAAGDGEGSGGLALVGAGLAVGLAAGGAGIGQGRTGAGAMEGIARNPQASDKIQTQMILALALMEALGIYGLVVALMIVLG